MARNRLPPSVPEESESESEKEESEPEEDEESESEKEESEPEEDEDEVEEEEQVVADEVNRKEAGSEEEEEEEDLSAKTTSQVRGLDYGSNGDSGKTILSPSVSDFVVKQNSKIEKDKEPKKKRLAESCDKSQVKKPKREKKKGNGAEKDVAVEDNSKRSAVGQRIWGAEDELKLLTGILEYKQENGVDFNSDLEAFYEYIKGSLKAVVDKNQLQNKIRKLKAKYCDNALKEANGQALVFSKGHEAEVYDHSKKIWGAVSREDGSAKVASRARNRKVSRKIDLGGTDVEMKGYIIPMPATAMEEDNFMFKKGMELVEKSKVDALNDKWTKYQLELAQLHAKKLDLVMERTKLILDALKSNP